MGSLEIMENVHTKTNFSLPCILCREDIIGASGDSKMCRDCYLNQVTEFYEKTHPVSVESLKSKWFPQQS